jgi:HAD superfamily hydrolase (TIGR01549 family)
LFCFSDVKGIIFDLDDTIVHAELDFAAMKRAIACPAEHDILSFIESLPLPQKAEAEQLVLEHELKDAKASRLIDGALEFILRAKQESLPLAIVTRNCRDATQLKLHQNNIPIDLVLTREDALPKPHPEALLKIASYWQLPTHELAYIGDYKYDIEAAHNANMQAWLFEYSAKNVQYEGGLRQIPKQ